MSRLIYVFILCCTISLPGCASAEIDHEFKSIDRIETFESELAKVVDKDSVLVVFDIDDTLLTSQHFFGGDAWYNWQSGKEVEHTNGEKVVIEEWRKPPCLLSELAITFEVGNYDEVEKDVTSNVVARIQADFDTLVLTSRSPAYRNGTIREMNEANLSFASEHMLKEDYETFSYLFNGRSVMYEKGLILSSGLNKGEVLRDFLKNKVKRTYSTIFFIDDGEHNLVNMGNEFIKPPSLNTELFLYTAVNKEISDGDMMNSRLSRVALNQFIQLASPGRFKEMQSAKTCPYPL